MDADGYHAFLHEARARLAQLYGDAPAYRRELGEAQRPWEAMGAGPRAAALSVELAPAAA